MSSTKGLAGAVAVAAVVAAAAAENIGLMLQGSKLWPFRNGTRLAF